MANVEILIAVPQKGLWPDGSAIAIKALGAYVSSAEFDAWLGGVAPAQVLALKDGAQGPHQAFVDQMSYLLGATAADAAMVRWGDQTPAHIALATERILHATDTYAKIQAQGYDTNWGFEDLKQHYAIVGTATQADMEELLREKDHRPHPFAKRQVVNQRRKKLNYGAILSASTIAQIKNPSAVLQVERGEDADIAALIEAVA